MPALKDPEAAYPYMINTFMPSGLKGIMVASLFAAYTSTVDTHLNWGASYMVNDLYKPFIERRKIGKNRDVLVSRISILLLTAIALIVTTKLQSILGVYKYLAVISGGIGTVAIARWYWWRVNPLSEISAIAASFIVGNLMEIFLPNTPTHDLWAVRAIITAAIATAVWIIVTLLTSKGPTQKAIEFYSKMRISGPCWKKVMEITHIEPIKNELKNNFIGWLLSISAVYSAMFAIGNLVFQRWIGGIICLLVAVISGYLLWRTIIKNRLHANPDHQAEVSKTYEPAGV